MHSTRTPRALRARATAALVVAPIAITDRTCAAVAGLDPEVWRALVTKLRVPRTMSGRRMIVLVSDYVGALERAAVDVTASTDRPDDQDDDQDDDQPRSIDDVLSRIGKRIVRGG